MKKSSKFLVLVTPIIFLCAFNFQQAIPAEIQGKWKLRGQNSKLVGSLDIKSNGTYTYSVLPNFKEAGTITVDASKQPKQINLIVKRKDGSTSTTMGIYNNNGTGLQLSLGKTNGARPASFSSPAGSGIIVWLGTK
jgi:uncharacterized protein (TIGR03067 family)